MKSYKRLSASITLAVLSSSLFAVPSAYATVGGELLIDAFTYNPINESVYYDCLTEVEEDVHHNL